MLRSYYLVNHKFGYLRRVIDGLKTALRKLPHRHYYLTYRWHANIGTTEIYIHVSIVKLKRILYQKQA